MRIHKGRLQNRHFLIGIIAAVTIGGCIVISFRKSRNAAREIAPLSSSSLRWNTAPRFEKPEEYREGDSEKAGMANEAATDSELQYMRLKEKINANEASRVVYRRTAVAEGSATHGIIIDQVVIDSPDPNWSEMIVQSIDDLVKRIGDDKLRADAQKLKIRASQRKFKYRLVSRSTPLDLVNKPKPEYAIVQCTDTDSITDGESNAIEGIQLFSSGSSTHSSQKIDSAYSVQDFIFESNPTGNSGG